MNVILALSTAIQQLREVSILSKLVNTDLMEVYDRRFYWNTTPGKNFTTDASVFR